MSEDIVFALEDHRSRNRTVMVKQLAGKGLAQDRFVARARRISENAVIRRFVVCRTESHVSSPSCFPVTAMTLENCDRRATEKKTNNRCFVARPAPPH